MDKIEQLLADGQVIRGDSFDIFALRDSERTETLGWEPRPGSALWDWLDAGNQFWALKTDQQVRFTAMGYEQVRVPPDLLNGLKEDGNNRVWTQGGYTYSVTRDEEGNIFTAIMGIPPGGSASKAWKLEATKDGVGRTFQEALEDTFTHKVPPDN